MINPIQLPPLGNTITIVKNVGTLYQQITVKCADCQSILVIYTNTGLTILAENTVVCCGKLRRLQ